MRKKTLWRGFVGLVLALLITGSLLLPAFAAETSIEKPVKTYEIAVVFDNSGSMYGGENENSGDSWCRAKFAMEIFASMLNFGNGDRMTIFPMWYVSTGQEPEQVSKNEVTPVTVEKSGDLQKITYMFTPHTNGSGTPFEPVEEAHRFLQTSTKTSPDGSPAVKWLIVLTDGQFNYKKRTDRNDDNFSFMHDGLRDRFLDMASQDLRVQYLAIGEAISQNEDLSDAASPEKNFYADTARDTSAVTDKMIEICNRIFERKALPDKFISAGEQKLTLDVSMSNVVVFVAGKGAKITSLTDSQGNAIAPASDSGLRRYSDLKYSNGKQGGYYATKKVDDSLYGQVVTYEKCPKGTYTLNFSGKIQVFYEPDIRIDIKIATDPEGKDVIEPNREGEIKTLEEGEYYVFYDLVDNVTSEPVTDNPLVDIKSLEASVRIEKADGSSRTVKLDKSGSPMAFTEGEKIIFEVEGEYLDGYRIRTQDNLNEFTFLIKKPTTLRLKLTQGQSWYQSGKELEWEPITAEVTLGKKSLDPAIFNKCELDLAFEPEIAYQLVPDPDHSRYLIYPGRDENGNAVKLESGQYKIRASIRCTDENEKISPSKQVSDSFKVHGYPVWYPILLAILILLLIAAIILFILSRKAMPKKIRLVPDSTEFRVKGKRIVGMQATVKYNRKGRSLQIKTPPYDRDPLASGTVTLRLQPVDRLWTKSKNRRVTVVGISASGSIAEIDLSGITYEKHPRTHQWTDSNYIDDDAVHPIRQNVRNADVNFEMRSGRTKISDLSCSLKHG